MKVRDLLLQKQVDIVDPSPFFLDGNLNISDVKPNDTFPSKISVRNNGGEIEGYVDRDTLSFIYEKCQQNIYYSIAEKFNDGIILIDSSGRIFFVNDSYSKILGVSKNYVLGKFLQKIEPGAEMLGVLENRREILDKQVHIKSLNKYVMVNIYPIERDGQLLAVTSVFRDVTETKKLNRELDRAHEIAEYFRQKLLENEKIGEKEIIGTHPAFLKTITQAMIVAKTDAPVLIFGDNGAGKEILARFIHRESNRRHKPMITVNCAAIPENLFESELFGYEEGSFTGALKGGKLGKFELAQGGTIFLDEIGDMPTTMQPKILRVLQEKEIEKIGRIRELPVDVRILAATNHPLHQMVNDGKFRNDLYYRLNVVAIKIPPLKERGEDIDLLAHHFLNKYNAKYNKNVMFSDEVITVMQQYQWPGNVRELQNCIERAVIMCLEEKICLDHLPGHITEHALHPVVNNSASVKNSSLKKEVDSLEKEMIEKTLAECKNNKSLTMKKLGISRRTFYKKLHKHNLIS
jgi:PAS domain S-box-containing protein